MLKNRRNKRNIFFLSLVLTILVIGIFLVLRNEKLSQNNLENSILKMEIMSYLHSTNDFMPITAEEIERKIQDDSILVYVGRITCEWCRKISSDIKRNLYNEWMGCLLFG